MAPQLHALRRHRVQRRRLEFIPAGHLPAVFILLRPVDAHIPPAHVLSLIHILVTMGGTDLVALTGFEASDIAESMGIPGWCATIRLITLSRIPIRWERC